jgi:hypothetical protein
VRDTDLYRHLLGLEAPWEVDRVELSVADGRVDVWVRHPDRTRFACPDCDTPLPVYDHSAERAWRHLDSCAFLTFLHLLARASDVFTLRPMHPSTPAQLALRRACTRRGAAVIDGNRLLQPCLFNPPFFGLYLLRCLPASGGGHLR